MSPSNPRPATHAHPYHEAARWSSLTAIGPDHPLTSLRPPAPRTVAESMRRDPTAAVWWTARAERLAAASIVGARAGRFISVEAVFYRVSGATAWDALDALTATGPLPPGAAAIFPPEVLAAWGAGVGPDDLPALYLPTPPHNGFRLLPFNAAAWERSPTGIDTHPRRSAPTRDGVGLLCRLYLPAELRALVSTGLAAYLPRPADPDAPDPWDLRAGGGDAPAGTDPAGRFYRPDAPDPADTRGTALAPLAPPSRGATEALAAVPAEWREPLSRWTRPVAGERAAAPAGGTLGASTSHRMRRAVVLRVGALPPALLVDAGFADGTSPGRDTDTDAPADHGGWRTRVSPESPAWGLPAGEDGLHSLAAFLDAHGVPPPPGCVPVAPGIVVWVGPRQTAAHLRSAITGMLLARARTLLRARYAAELGPAWVDHLHRCLASGDTGSAPEPFPRLVDPEAPDPHGRTVTVWGCRTPRALVERVEEACGIPVPERPAEGFDAWARSRIEVNPIGQLLEAAEALSGDGPAVAPARLLAALVWPDRTAARLLRVQFAAMGLGGEHWRAAAGELVAWLDTCAPVTLPMGAHSLWWSLKAGTANTAHLPPPGPRHPEAGALFPPRDREALARFDATLARPDAPEALRMVRLDRDRAQTGRAPRNPAGEALGEAAGDEGDVWW